MLKCISIIIFPLHPYLFLHSDLKLNYLLVMVKLSSILVTKKLKPFLHICWGYFRLTKITQIFFRIDLLLNLYIIKSNEDVIYTKTCTFRKWKVYLKSSPKDQEITDSFNIWFCTDSPNPAEFVYFKPRYRKIACLKLKYITNEEL